MPTGQILLVFALVFGVVVGAFWLLVQRPEQQTTASGGTGRAPRRRRGGRGAAASRARPRTSTRAAATP